MPKSKGQTDEKGDITMRLFKPSTLIYINASLRRIEKNFTKNRLNFTKSLANFYKRVILNISVLFPYIVNSFIKNKKGENYV